jgi:hypothetical protein
LHLLLQPSLLVLSFSVATLFFGLSLEVATDFSNVAYVGGIKSGKN